MGHAIRKMKKIILITIVAYFVMLISGESIGGPLLIYFILGLFVPTTSSLYMFAGTLLYLFSMYKYQTSIIRFSIPLGTVLLYFGYITFFLSDKQHYNYETFHQAVPMGTLFLFIIVSIYLNIRVFTKRSHS